MKRLVALVLTLAMLGINAHAISIAKDDEISITAPHAILMEKETGTVIYEKSADEAVPPASVTKVMTILLIVEALDAGTLTLEETITTSAYASSMGGSQIYLSVGETMSMRDMLKSIVVVSANDAAVAVAEHIAGTEENFVKKMNERAAELGMTNTHFSNCTGLFDDDTHYTTARDVALMSRELISHDMIKDYTSIWMDTVRDGEFGLSNTNKLLRRYDGITGLKTGYTELAGHCLSATAMRDGTEYIAVVLGCSSSDDRFEDASILLNYAFANYSLVELTPSEAIPPVKVSLGEQGSVQPSITGESKMLLEKQHSGAVEYDIELIDAVEAPVAKNQSLGNITVSVAGEEIAQLNLVSDDEIARIGLIELFKLFISQLYS